jgi:hypothetical protein
MRTREEVINELRRIEESEEEAKKQEQRKKNYEKFKARPTDFMVGRAHAEIDFINERYASDRDKELLPATVSVTGNSGTFYRGKAPVTKSTYTYFRNVWNTNYTRYEDKFQKELDALVQKYVKLVCGDLVCVLEMMGLQSLSYYLTTEHFPNDKIDEVKADVEAAQAELLDKYADEDFLKLIRNQTGWVTKSGEPVPEHLDVDLSHSRMILYRYIFHKRPSLQEKFRKTEFYQKWKEKIEPEHD